MRVALAAAGGGGGPLAPCAAPAATSAQERVPDALDAVLAVSLAEVVVMVVFVESIAFLISLISLLCCCCVVAISLRWVTQASTPAWWRTFSTNDEMDLQRGTSLALGMEAFCLSWMVFCSFVASSIRWWACAVICSSTLPRDGHSWRVGWGAMVPRIGCSAV